MIVALFPFILYINASSDHRVKDKERDKKRERDIEKDKEWKNHKIPPVNDIARENGEVSCPQKGKDEVI